MLQLLQQGFARFAQENPIRALVRFAPHAHRQRTLFQFVQHWHDLRGFDCQRTRQVGLHQPGVLVDDRQGGKLCRAQVMGREPGNKVLKQLQLRASQGVADQVFKHPFSHRSSHASVVGTTGRPSHQGSCSSIMGNKVTYFACPYAIRLERLWKKAARLPMG
ncbi:hypothetical protein D3C81_1571840 [compost metagenome]